MKQSFSPAKRLMTMSGLVLIAALAIIASPSSVSAASAGLAWDSVMKLSLGADPSTLQPGAFDADYAAAAAAPQSSGGGIFGHMVPQGMMQMMQSGIAERHYVAGSKERTDQPQLGTATILDCSARTLTTLDLKKKTYRVVSLDRPNDSTSGSSNGAGNGPFKGDDTKIAIVVTNKSLGSRQIGNQTTNGYSSQMQFAITRASGETETHDGSLTAYYANFATPAVQCSAMNNPRSMKAGAEIGMFSGVATQIMRALQAAGMDKRFSVKQTGPNLPLGNFAVYQALAFDAHGRSMTVITERGNSRPIDAGDAEFSVPSDFTREQ
ncbi:MAG TPA: hypothetical protein VHX17_13780 [Candidatus Cybelea sp.]|jgi:hypothetical protein|nr:hypothetical protein [Candidatus Cybelea sp.]